MSGTEQQINEEHIKGMLEGVFSGMGLGEAAGISKETLEAGYALGHSLYNSGNFKDAETMFQALSIYDHTDARHWMGLGGCRQVNGKLELAIDAYNMAAFQGAFTDPTPLLHSGLCYLKLGDKENAGALFESISCVGDEKNNEHRACKERALAMLELLKKGGAA